VAEESSPGPQSMAAGIWCAKVEVNFAQRHTVATADAEAVPRTEQSACTSLRVGDNVEWTLKFTSETGGPVRFGLPHISQCYSKVTIDIRVAPTPAQVGNIRSHDGAVQ